MKRSSYSIIVMVGMLVLFVGFTGSLFAREPVDPFLIEDWAMPEGSPLRGLYPEIQYRENPSVLVDIEGLYLVPFAFAQLGGSETVVTGTEDSPNEAGGTETETGSFANIWALGARTFVPVANATYGGGVAFNRQNSEEEVELDGYEFDGQDRTETEVTNRRWGISGEGFLAFDLDALDFGLRLSGQYDRQPADVLGRRITEDGDTFYDATHGDELDDRDRTSQRIGLTPSLRLPVGDGFLSLGVSGDFSTWRLLPYYFADTDGDGEADSLVSTDEFHTDDDWGEGLDDYEYEAVARRISIVVRPGVMLPLSETTHFVGSASLAVYDVDTYNDYEWTDADDQSEFTAVQTRSFRTFGVNGGIAYAPSSAWELRTGLGVEREAWVGERSGLDFDGEPSEDEHVHQSLPDPTDEQIIANGNRIGRSELDLIASASVRFAPIERLTLFTAADFGIGFGEETFTAFDTESDELVDASVQTRSFDLNTDLTLGAAIEFTDSFTLSIGSNLLTNPIGFGADSSEDVTGAEEPREESSWSANIGIAGTLSF